MGVRREVADPLEDGEAKGLTADERRVVSSVTARLLSTASARNVHADSVRLFARLNQVGDGGI